MEQQQAQERAVLRRIERDHARSVVDLERPEDPELHEVVVPRAERSCHSAEPALLAPIYSRLTVAGLVLYRAATRLPP